MKRASRDPLQPVVDEKQIARRLYTAGQPEPDLLIRTSGEMRVSNFLLWQIAYAELYVTETLCPISTAPTAPRHSRLSAPRTPLRRTLRGNRDCSGHTILRDPEIVVSSQ